MNVKSFSVRGSKELLDQFKIEAEIIGYKKIKDVLFKGDVINVLFFPLNMKGDYHIHNFWGYEYNHTEKNEFDLSTEFDKALQYAKDNFPLKEKPE